MTTAQSALTYNGRERRRYLRQALPEDTLVFINKEPGTVIDMSEGGVAIHFVSLRPEHPQPLQIDIFHGASQLYLPELPVRLVNEIALLPYPLFSSLSRHRLCMEFGQLTSTQRLRLHDFLRHHDTLPPSAVTPDSPTQERLL